MISLLLLLHLGALAASEAAVPSYPKSDSLMKGYLQVPQEFVDGTASEKAVMAWARSLIAHFNSGRRELDTESLDYDEDGIDEILVGIPWTYGTGGRVVMYFDGVPSGYKYLGELPNPDRSKRYPDRDYCYSIDASGNWESVRVTLYRVGPDRIEPVGVKDLARRGDGFFDRSFLEFPSSEDELLSRFPPFPDGLGEQVQ